MARLDQARLDAAFRTLETFASAGMRCPENGTHGIESPLTTALARAGRIRILIYAHNWRVVEIVTGPHAGAKTELPPNRELKPWRVIGIEDTHTHGSRTATPSAPRALSSAELSKL